GPEPATLHLLPSLWFRNTWSWNGSAEKPALQAVSAPTGAAWAIRADHPTLGNYHLYGHQPGELLFTGNETNAERLWGVPNAAPYVKDAFHRLDPADAAYAVRDINSRALNSRLRMCGRIV